MHHKQYRYQNQRTDDQRHANSFKASKRARACRRDNNRRRNQDACNLGKSQIVEAKADPDELGDDRERVENKQIYDAECAPEFSEPFEDEARVADASDHTEPQHHFLIDIKHWHEQQQHPEKAGAVILPGLGVGAKRTRIIVADHHDKARSNDG